MDFVFYQNSPQFAGINFTSDKPLKPISYVSTSVHKSYIIQCCI